MWFGGLSESAGCFLRLRFGDGELPFCHHFAFVVRIAGAHAARQAQAHGVVAAAGELVVPPAQGGTGQRDIGAAKGALAVLPVPSALLDGGVLREIGLGPPIQRFQFVFDVRRHRQPADLRHIGQVRIFGQIAVLVYDKQVGRAFQPFFQLRIGQPFVDGARQEMLQRPMCRLLFNHFAANNADSLRFFVRFDFQVKGLAHNSVCKACAAEESVRIVYCISGGGKSSLHFGAAVFLYCGKEGSLPAISPCCLCGSAIGMLRAVQAALLAANRSCDTPTRPPRY